MLCHLIDHDDSFTYNLVDWLKNSVQAKVIVTNHKHTLLQEEFYSECDFVLLSAGPNRPEDYPRTLALLKLLEGKTPLIGICLGMQMMATHSGSKLEIITPPVHGKSDKITFTDEFDTEFSGKSFTVARYHSLGFKQINGYKTLAKNDEGIVMAICSEEKKSFGVQFHPESFLTEKSDIIANGIIQKVNRWNQHL